MHRIRERWRLEHWWPYISKCKNLIKIFLYFFSAFSLSFAFAFYFPLTGLAYLRQRTSQHWMNFKRYIYQIEIILANAKWWWSALFSRLRHAVAKLTVKYRINARSTSQATWYHQYFPTNISRRFFFLFSFSLRFLLSPHFRQANIRWGWEINCKTWLTEPRNTKVKRRKKNTKRTYSANRFLNVMPEVGVCVYIKRQFEVCFINEMSKNINNNLIAGNLFDGALFWFRRIVKSTFIWYILPLQFNMFLQKKSVRFFNEVDKKRTRKLKLAKETVRFVL